MDTQTAQRKATIACPHCGRLNRVDLARAGDGPKCGQCSQRIELGHPLALTDASFQRVIEDAQVPVVVDFYADWCGPCRMMAPSVDALAKARLGEGLVAKLNTDHNPATASRLGITGLPTVIVFSGGREAAREMGALSRPALDALVNRVPR